MTTAVVLIEAERNALTTLGGELADLDGHLRGVVGDGRSGTSSRSSASRSHEQLADVVTGRDLRAGGRHPDADHGRLRGLLQARSGGHVLHRPVGSGP